MEQEVPASDRIGSLPAPSLCIEPDRIPWSRQGTVTVSWSGTGAVPWEVFVARDDRPAQLFGVGVSGSRTIDWISPDSRYQFRLYPPGAVGQARVVRSIQMGDPPPRPPFVVAYPDPVTFHQGVGRATIAWDTGDGAEGTLVLVADGKRGDEETTIGSGPYGAITVDWLAPTALYRFRLYRTTQRHEPIAAITIPSARHRRETLIDLTVLTVLGAAILFGLLLLVSLLRTLRGPLGAIVGLVDRLRRSFPPTGPDR